MTSKMTSSSTAQGGTRPRIQRPCMLHSIKAPMTPSDECNYTRAKEISTWNEILNDRNKPMLLPKPPPSTPTLKSPTNQKSSLFLFDPVHTLQFLLSELESKLMTSHPDDKAVPKILLEMQQTVKRVASVKVVPLLTAPRSSCTLQENVENQENRVKRLNSSCQTNEYNSATLREEKAAQTETDPCKDFTGFTGFDRFSMETQIKQSHEKLKGNCDALEKACAALQDEKIHIHKELRKCRDEIAALKTEISYLQTILEETRSANKCTAGHLDEQRKRLHDEVRILQDFLSKQIDQRMVVESLNSKLKESSDKILLLEKSRIENDKILVFTKLEKEKLMILQKYQAEQIQNLQVDLKTFHKLIKDQLNVIQNSVRHRSPKNTLSRFRGKITDRSQITLSTKKKTFAQNPVMVSKNAASNQLPNSDASDAKRGKNVQRKGKLMMSLQQGESSAAAVSGADESFETKSIILNDRFPEHESAIETELSSPRSSSVPKPLVKPSLPTMPLEPPTVSADEEAHRSHRGLPATSVHRKKHFGNEGRLQNQHPQSGAGVVQFDEVQAGAMPHQPPTKTKKRATIKKIRSDFDEFKKLLDDVIPTTPTKDLRELSFSNSPDMSLNFSQLNNSNEQS